MVDLSICFFYVYHSPYPMISPNLICSMAKNYYLPMYVITAYYLPRCVSKNFRLGLLEPHLVAMALWTVTGGQKTGGLQVRRGAALSRALEQKRLEFGSTVREMARSHLADWQVGFLAIMVDFASYKMVIVHSHVNVYQRVE